MHISQALHSVELVATCDASVEVIGVQYDSRRVRPGDLFVAMRGGASDGNRFVTQAIERGAAAIVSDSPDHVGLSVPVYVVAHGRRALAGIAANLLHHPERKLKVSAVTGTNGKTTTAFLLEQMLKSVGRRCLLIGTIEIHVGDEVRVSEHTTPEASDLLQLFADGLAAGCTEVVMEMSSHALDQERVWGIPVDVAIFTNLTQDHLDYHGTLGAYARAKSRLFRGSGTLPPRVAIVNGGADYASAMKSVYAKAGGEQLVEFNAQGYDSAFAVGAISLRIGETRFKLTTEGASYDIISPLTGRVNVENLTGAIAAAVARGLSLNQVLAAVPNLAQVPGRFQIVEGSRKEGVTVVVDYAHTEDALRNLMALAREQVAPQDGAVITMFGCGGDRDRTKRPRMGRAAGENSDLVIVTTDNPRTEDPAQIIQQILDGLLETPTTYRVEADRKAAIAVAINAAKPGDIVLLAGKGHEKVQIFADFTLPFDDVAVSSEVLRTLS